MYDDPMDIDLDCVEVPKLPNKSIDPWNQVVEVGGHVWNATRYEMIFGPEVPLDAVQENIFSKEIEQKRRMEKTRLTVSPAKAAGYSFTLSKRSVYDIPNISIFTGYGGSLKPMRKFYLKVSRSSICHCTLSFESGFSRNYLDIPLSF